MVTPMTDEERQRAKERAMANKEQRDEEARMSDITHEAPERIWLQLGAGDEGTHTWADHQVGWDDEGEYEPEYVRADLVQAAVAAALREAAEVARRCKAMPPADAILALITDDAQAALDRYVKERSDEVQAAVAAALTEAMNCCTAELRNTAMLMSNPPQSSAAWDARNAILDLITTDAQAALDRAVAAERERCAKIVEDQYMVDGIAEILAEDLAAAIRKGSNERSEEGE